MDSPARTARSALRLSAGTGGGNSYLGDIATRLASPVVTHSRESSNESLSSLNSREIGSSSFFGASLSAAERDTEIKRVIFTAINDEDQAALSDFLITYPSSTEVLQLLLTTTYPNTDIFYQLDEEVLNDAAELLGPSMANLNAIQIACVLNAEDMALDLLDFVARTTDEIQSRKVLYEFMGRVWGDGNTVLHLAAFQGMSELVKRLLELGAASRKKNDRNYRPVDCADDQVTTQMFSKVVDVEGSIVPPSPPIADQQPFYSSIEDFLQSKPRPQGRKSSEANDEVHQGDPIDSKGRNLEDAEDAVTKELSIGHVENGLGKTLSIRNPQSEKSSAKSPRKSSLSKSGTTGNGKPRRGLGVQFDSATVLMYLCQHGPCVDPSYLDRIQECLKSIEDINEVRTSQKGLTPLHQACTYGHVDLVKLLLETTRIRVNVFDIEGWTPLHCACAEGHLEVVVLLGRCRAEGDDPPEDGPAFFPPDGPIDLIATNGDGETAEDVLEDNEPIAKILAALQARYPSGPRPQLVSMQNLTETPIDSTEALSAERETIPAVEAEDDGVVNAYLRNLEPSGISELVSAPIAESDWEMVSTGGVSVDDETATTGGGNVTELPETTAGSRLDENEAEMIPAQLSNAENAPVVMLPVLARPDHIHMGTSLETTVEPSVSNASAMLPSPIDLAPDVSSQTKPTTPNIQAFTSLAESSVEKDSSSSDTNSDAKVFVRAMVSGDASRIHLETSIPIEAIEDPKHSLELDQPVLAGSPTKRPSISTAELLVNRHPDTLVSAQAEITLPNASQDASSIADAEADVSLSSTAQQPPSPHIGANPQLPSQSLPPESEHGPEATDSTNHQHHPRPPPSPTHQAVKARGSQIPLPSPRSPNRSPTTSTTDLVSTLSRTASGIAVVAHEVTLPTSGSTSALTHTKPRKQSGDPTWSLESVERKPPIDGSGPTYPLSLRIPGGQRMGSIPSPTPHVTRTLMAESPIPPPQRTEIVSPPAASTPPRRLRRASQSRPQIITQRSADTLKDLPPPSPASTTTMTPTRSRMARTFSTTAMETTAVDVQQILRNESPTTPNPGTGPTGRLPPNGFLSRSGTRSAPSRKGTTAASGGGGYHTTVVLPVHVQSSSSSSVQVASSPPWKAYRDTLRAAAASPRQSPDVPVGLVRSGSVRERAAAINSGKPPTGVT
ncbi:hypothetical protein HKX48_006908 [Thoreauomyces humboldtii]|nr:hypothetical protein HKX48_006908 [Thoreauomyces humboldtii]